MHVVFAAGKSLYSPFFFLCDTVFVWPDSTFFVKPALLTLDILQQRSRACSAEHWSGRLRGPSTEETPRSSVHGHGFGDALRGRGIAESADRRTRPAGDRVSGQPSCPVAAVASLVVGAACASGELGIWMSKIL